MRSTSAAVCVWVLFLSAANADTWIGKYLLAWKCLLAIHSVDPQNPDLHVESYRFREALGHQADGASTKVSKIVFSESERLFPRDENLSDWNEDFLARHKSSASHIQAGVRVRGLIDKSKKGLNEHSLTATLTLDTISMQEAKLGLELLREWGSSAEVKETYRNRAAERWKQATVFQGQTHLIQA